MGTGKALLCVGCLSLLVGCGSGTNSASSGSGATGSSSDYAAPTQTIFMGDVITQDWPLATSAAYDIPLSNGTASGFDRYASVCVSGCTPAALQMDAPGMKTCSAAGYDVFTVAWKPSVSSALASLCR